MDNFNHAIHFLSKLIENANEGDKLKVLSNLKR
jgi:hypothetical protein